MASVSSPTNSAGESVDALVTSASTTGILKSAVNSRSVSGGVANVAEQGVATGVDDAAFTPAGESIVVMGGFADDTSTDSVDENDKGALRMGLDRILYTRQVGPHGTRAVAAVSVGTSATAMPSSVLANRKRLSITNNGASTLYIGTSGVTTSTGTPIPAGSGWDEEGDIALYGIVASGTVDVRVMESS